MDLKNHETLSEVIDVATDPTDAIADAVDASNPQKLAIWMVVQIFYSYYLGPLVNNVFTALGFGGLGTVFGTWVSWYYSPLGFLIRAFIFPFISKAGLADEALTAPAAWICLVASILWVGRRFVNNNRD